LPKHLDRRIPVNRLASLGLRKSIRLWRDEYNNLRPHSSLGYMTPHEFAESFGGREKAMLQI